MRLTPLQKEAVRHFSSPLLVIAGAGTGKTYTLVEKIKYLITEKKIKPEHILALTFTEKSAREIEERVDKILPIGVVQTRISTFHSFCDHFLRDEIIHIGLSPAYKLMTEAETVMFVKRYLFSMKIDLLRPLSNPTKFLESMVTHFSRLQDEAITADEYAKWTNNKKNKKKFGDEFKIYCELAEAFKIFEDLKKKENVLTFADLITHSLNLLKSRPSVKKRLQEQTRYIMVDEFQDTNIAQYKLLKILCPDGTNPHLTVIGDDNQSIYKFRGAAISNILQFKEDYPKAHEVVLTDNFRSNQVILDSAYRCIKYNDPDTLESRLNISKKLTSTVGRGVRESVSLYAYKGIEQESDGVAKEILNCVKKGKYSYGDVAILVRANNHAQAFSTRFSHYGIPFQFLGPSVLFKQSEIKELIAFLFFLNDLDDSASLYRVLTMDFFDISGRDLTHILMFTRKTHLSLFESIEAYLSFSYPNKVKEEKRYADFKKYLFSLSSHARHALLTIYSIILSCLEKIPNESAGTVLYHFIERSGYLAHLMTYSTRREEQIALNISRFFDRLRAYEINHEESSVRVVVEYIQMSMELGDSPTGLDTDQEYEDAVNILTIHSSKGLEFNVVFLVNLVTGRLPSLERKEKLPIPDSLIKEILPSGNAHIQEERRLFYVGITRAKKKLYLTASRYYGEGKRTRKISPFVSESLGENEVAKIIEKKEKIMVQIPIFDYQPISSTTESEGEAYLQQALTVFSYSQIETYTTCPLKHKYQYVLRIPIQPNAVTSFGDTIHKTLYHFYTKSRQEGKASIDNLLEFYHDLWVPLGYTTHSHEKRQRAEGEKMLRQYFKDYYRQTDEIISLESWFKIKLQTDLYLVGKIDRVDRKVSGRIEIIDYKTGKMPDKKTSGKSLQLSLYALASSDPSLYSLSVSDIDLSFHYLRDNTRVTFQRGTEEVDKVKEKIIAITTQINKGDHKPKVGPWCDFCPFKVNCEAWQG